MAALLAFSRRDLTSKWWCSAVGKIVKDIVNCPRLIAFEGASRKDIHSSFNLGQLTKKIHGESDKFDEEEAIQARHKDRPRLVPFGIANRVHIHLKLTSLCDIVVVGGGGGCSLKPLIRQGKLWVEQVRSRQKWRTSRMCTCTLHMQAQDAVRSTTIDERELMLRFACVRARPGTDQRRLFAHRCSLDASSSSVFQGSGIKPVKEQAAQGRIQQSVNKNYSAYDCAWEKTIKSAKQTSSWTTTTKKLRL